MSDHQGRLTEPATMEDQMICSCSWKSKRYFDDLDCEAITEWQQHVAAETANTPPGGPDE